MSEDTLDSLATIDPQTGAVPETRFKDALSVQNYVQRLCRNDESGGRTYKRARVNGIVDGNPPYKQSALLKAGRADACNVNWGSGRALLEAAQGPFYDLFSEASGYMEVVTAHGTSEEQAEWSRVISDQANCALDGSDTPFADAMDELDNLIQLSQREAIQHGIGPLLFEDEYCVFPLPIRAGDLKVPEMARSHTKRWEVAACIVPYNPSDLFAFIQNEKSASAMGWNIAYTKNVIANALDIKQSNGSLYDWEFYQRELKNNSANYTDGTKICWVAHVFWKEFSGKITHAIVQKDDSTSTELPVDYLYYHHERYNSFRECIHPMYFDRGNGDHHSVTGLGTKMYAGMEYQNRVLCKMADDVWLPKTLFRPTSPSATQKFTLTHFGGYGLLPAGFEPQQVAIHGLMNDELAFEQKITSLMDSNLSAYRQPIMRKEGNPVTARQVMYDASQQSSLSKTQVNRYYKQLDVLYCEMYRRLSNPNTNDETAKAFQKRCQEEGVPKLALTKTRSVRAIRVVGQGNNFMRQDVLDRAWAQYGPALPEEGRYKLITDGLAAGMGYLQARRYNPQPAANSLADDQRAEATQWVAAMKVGVPPVVTATQNPVTYATVFLQAGVAAAESLSQGANPMEVYNFLQIVGPAIVAHLQRFPQDPARQQLLKVLTAQWKQLAQVADDLKQKIQQDIQAQAQQQQATQQVLTDQQLKAMKVQSDIQLKTVKTQKQLEQSQARHEQKMREAQQNMVLKDATTASDIHRKNTETAVDMSMSQLQPAEEPTE